MHCTIRHENGAVVDGGVAMKLYGSYEFNIKSVCIVSVQRRSRVRAHEVHSTTAVSAAQNFSASLNQKRQNKFFVSYVK